MSLLTRARQRLKTPPPVPSPALQDLQRFKASNPQWAKVERYLQFRSSRNRARLCLLDLHQPSDQAQGYRLQGEEILITQILGPDFMARVEKTNAKTSPGSEAGFDEDDD